MASYPVMDPADQDDRLAVLPGFGPGVHLMSQEGEIPVEWLATGDKLITRDHGLQPVLWIGRARMKHTRLARNPQIRPMEIATGALGAGVPTHPTLLAPAARVLLNGADVELHTGHSEALAEIGDLRDDQLVTMPATPTGTHYTFVLLPVHDMVEANGLWAETLLLDARVRQALQDDLPAVLANDRKLRMGHAMSARLCLDSYEVTAIRGKHKETSLSELISHAA